GDVITVGRRPDVAADVAVFDRHADGSPLRRTAGRQDRENDEYSRRQHTSHAFLPCTARVSVEQPAAHEESDRARRTSEPIRASSLRPDVSARTTVADLCPTFSARVKVAHVDIARRACETTPCLSAVRGYIRARSGRMSHEL